MKWNKKYISLFYTEIVWFFPDLILIECESVCGCASKRKIL